MRCDGRESKKKGEGEGGVSVASDDGFLVGGVVVDDDVCLLTLVTKTPITLTMRMAITTAATTTTKGGESRGTEKTTRTTATKTAITQTLTARMKMAMTMLTTMTITEEGAEKDFAVAADEAIFAMTSDNFVT